MRRFYLHARHNGVFYAELVDPRTGRKPASRSTGTKSRDEALRIVTALKDRGLINSAAVKAGKGAVNLTEFFKAFWDYTVSPYIREKLAHGQSIGKRHCYESMSRFNRYWGPAFKGRNLDSITRQDLKDFSLDLAEKKLSPASINKITTALSWAYREGKITVDPTGGLVNFSGGAKKRGVLIPPR
ncbi:MAG: hypothetical protein LBO80_11815 [Treponema sp.]|jgi:hypothetical protein|nr:hypothetical protein [Treponema sp.]